MGSAQDLSYTLRKNILLAFVEVRVILGRRHRAEESESLMFLSSRNNLFSSEFGLKSEKHSSAPIMWGRERIHLDSCLRAAMEPCYSPGKSFFFLNIQECLR